MRELDYLAASAAGDKEKMNSLIQQNEYFILKCASAVTHRYIRKSDDEWSLALMAFASAIQSYALDKGSFLSFAELVIRRRLIDYCRTQTKYSAEIPVNPAVFNTDSEEDNEDVPIRLAIAEQVSHTEDDSLRLEIEAANLVFAEYGFSFFDLVYASPKAGKTKALCAIASCYLLRNPILIHEMRKVKQLPQKIIEKNAKIPRKILERHRKYIIAAVEILSGDYPCLAEYMHYIRKELEQ